MITGGTGAFGTAFAKHLLWLRDPPERIVVYSRGEFRQFCMAKDLESLDRDQRLRFMIGDVRDQSRLRRAMNRVQVVVHAAALKRIEVGNYNPVEMVKTNVDGTINVIEAAQDAGVKKVIFLSSDKAFQPVSPYGHTKALAEAICLAANNIVGGAVKFAATRYGNVWRSTGSVVPVWESILRTTPEVPVTDPDCTRFFMRMDQAVALVMEAIDTTEGGETFIPTLPAYRLGDLAEAMGAKMRITGLPKYEKRHESMEEGNSSDKARRMSIEELKRALNGQFGGGFVAHRRNGAGAQAQQ